MVVGQNPLGCMDSIACPCSDDMLLTHNVNVSMDAMQILSPLDDMNEHDAKQAQQYSSNITMHIYTIYTQHQNHIRMHYCFLISDRRGDAHKKRKQLHANKVSTTILLTT